MTRSFTAVGGLIAGVTSVTAAVALTVSASPAWGDTTYSVSGTVAGASCSGQVEVDVARRTTADDPSSYFAADDGYYYDFVDSQMAANGSSYTETGLLTGATYRFDFSASTVDDGQCAAFRGYVTMPSADQSLDATLKEPATCTSAAGPSGSAQVGQTLTAPTASFSPDYAQNTVYQWYRRDPQDVVTAIAGARDRTYAPSASDVGDQLAVSVMGTSSFGTAACDYTDLWSLPIASAPQVATPRSFALGALGRPRGAARVGTLLRVPRFSVPTGTTVLYQWFRVVRTHHHTRVRPVVGAQRSSYRVHRRDVGARLFVRISLSATGYVPTTVQSGSSPVRR